MTETTLVRPKQMLVSDRWTYYNINIGSDHNKIDVWHQGSPELFQTTATEFRIWLGVTLERLSETGVTFPSIIEQEQVVEGRVSWIPKLLNNMYYKQTVEVRDCDTQTTK